MKRQICSYDMVAVPSHSYTLTDGEGDIYLCNPRCLCIWAVLLVTKSNLPEGVRERSFILTGPSGVWQRFGTKWAILLNTTVSATYYKTYNAGPIQCNPATGYNEMSHFCHVEMP